MARPKSVKSVAKLNDDDKVLYRKLTDYLQEVYLNTVGYEPPWALFMTQIKDIKNHYDINYDKILEVLKYMNEAGETHKKLESIYSEYIDFQALSDYSENLLGEIFLNLS